MTLLRPGVTLRQSLLGEVARRGLLIELARGVDIDAVSYITAVETADGQALENGVKTAINDFVVGCKADGIWDALKASCIMAGARTLNGALVPLVGDAPTNFNFVSGDYDRKTGLKGDGSTKYLDSNRAGDADPQNNAHLATYTMEVVAAPNAPAPYYIGSGSGGTGAKGILRLSVLGSLNAHAALPTSSTPIEGVVPNPASGFLGFSRTGATAAVFRDQGAAISSVIASQVPTSDDAFVFSRNNGSGVAERFNNARMSFYSIGEALDLEALDTRVTALMTAIDGAIA
jgi:hypothetical protein